MLWQALSYLHRLVLRTGKNRLACSGLWFRLWNGWSPLLQVRLLHPDLWLFYEVHQQDEVFCFFRFHLISLREFPSILKQSLRFLRLLPLHEQETILFLLLFLPLLQAVFAAEAVHHTAAARLYSDHTLFALCWSPYSHVRSLHEFSVPAQQNAFHSPTVPFHRHILLSDPPVLPVNVPDVHGLICLLLFSAPLLQSQAA